MIAGKDEAIRSFLQQLDMPMRRWIVVDHWEADTCAIGIAAESNPRRLVYVSIYGKEPDRFDYECEVGCGTKLDEYAVVGRGQDVTFDELLKVMEAHLC